MRALKHLEEILENVIAAMNLEWPQGVTIEPPKDKQFGDMATNLAMLLARQAKRKPRDIAEEIRTALADDSDLESVEVAGPGFLNFTYAPSFWRKTLEQVHGQGNGFGAGTSGKGRRVQIEFVSANPTGPLHIGHGRGAALGDSLCRILQFSGFDVSSEYYINDAGRQMRLLGLSIWTRYQQIMGRDVEFPEDGYKGDYIRELAQVIVDEHGPFLLQKTEKGAEAFCTEYGMVSILSGIRNDLADFRVNHEIWFSEKRLVDSGKVQTTLEALLQNELAHEKDGALWFETTRYGDDKDRVLRKSSGDLTYFASDIAYHADKFERGFDLVVDIWGADHHGYIPRMKAAVQALGKDAEQLQIILVQLVNLLRGGEQVAMSTRAGEFETLADVVREVGVDSARFIFLSRKSDSKLDFDLELVKQQSMENPVYYVQYAHARINSMLRKAAESKISVAKFDRDGLSVLDTPEDLALLKQLDQFPDAVEAAARSLSPHHVSFYLRDLAGLLHRYYTVHPVLAADSPAMVQARLQLMLGVAQVLKNGLALLGVNAPDSM